MNDRTMEDKIMFLKSFIGLPMILSPMILS